MATVKTTFPLKKFKWRVNLYPPFSVHRGIYMAVVTSNTKNEQYNLDIRAVYAVIITY